MKLVRLNGACGIVTLFSFELRTDYLSPNYTVIQCDYYEPQDSIFIELPILKAQQNMQIYYYYYYQL